jgi:ABC-type multidrug transport system fused ATPase/permease subunit
VRNSKIKNKLVRRLEKRILYRAILLFDKKVRKKLFAIAFIQIILGGLDLIGVSLIGLIGALSVTGVKSGLPGGRLESILNFMGLSGMTFQQQVAILGILAVLFLVGKTVISAIFTKKILYFLGLQGAAISNEILKSSMSKSFLFIRTRNIQELIYQSSNGVTALSIGVVGGALNLIADISMTIIIATALLIIDPTIAVLTFTIFSLVMLVLNKATQNKSRDLGILYTDLSIESINRYEQAYKLYREIHLGNTSAQVEKEINAIRKRFSSVVAEISFLPSLSKYVIETTIVIGALILSAYQFMAQDSSSAVATLSVFLAAGTRIAPALLRIQQGILTVKNSSGAASGTMSLIEELAKSPNYFLEKQVEEKKPFIPRIAVSNLYFKFSHKDEGYLFENLNFELAPGSRTALVGPSGSGKSTLIDIMLGIIPPSSGKVQISGVAAQDSHAIWPGSIGFVPQDVWMIDGSIKDNILLGRGEHISNEAMSAAISNADLTEFIESLPRKLETVVGSDGQALSGGQRQRIGIARALLSNPGILVLDEATSSLDSNSERSISSSIAKLSQEISVMVIAHRLSSIREFQRIVYMDKGKILASGTFAEVCAQVPDFEMNAKAMGLK